MRLAHYIAGKWETGTQDDARAIVNPATGERLGSLPVADAAALQRALASAERGFRLWKQVSPFERSKLLRRWAQHVRDRSDAIAHILTSEQGKPLAEARGEILNSADVIDWFAEEGRRAYGRIIPSRIAGHEQLLVKEPVGPAALFTTWNFPASGPCRKIASALAAGCSCILKPAEETPGTAVAIVEALVDAELPEGVANLVLGDPREISEALLLSPIIRAVSFTGSTVVGKQIATLAAAGVKRATLELGGHSPVLIFDDVDVAQVAALSIDSKFRNAGQVCMSPTRFYVQDRIYESFLGAFIDRARSLKVGDGTDPDSVMGPLANPRRVAAMEHLVRDAVERGATLHAGGERVGNSGYFFQPTVLGDVPDDALIMTDEPFGPVAVVNRFTSFDDAIAAANRLPFGLAAYAFARDNRLVHALGSGLEAGIVAINSYAIAATETPFGGIKESGYGLEGGSEGLAEFLTTKMISRM